MERFYSNDSYGGEPAGNQFLVLQLPMLVRSGKYILYSKEKRCDATVSLVCAVQRRPPAARCVACGALVRACAVRVVYRKQRKGLFIFS